VRKLRSYALAMQEALAASRRSQHIPVKARPMDGSVWSTVPEASR